MQGDIALSMGLVLAANARLRGLSTPSWPDGSIYLFCNKVDFIGAATKGLFRSKILQSFPDPNAWLNHIQQSGQGVKLRLLQRGDPNISDRNSVGLAGGGPVVLIETHDSKRGAWRSHWQVTKQSAQDRRIWSVTYQESPAPPTPEEVYSSAEIRGELRSALTDAIGFSSAHNMGFDDYLLKGSETLNSARPLENFYHADVVPSGLVDLDNQQILGCCSAAWVFGGMGSWNDVWFEGPDQSDYERVSDRLFNAIMKGVMAATNSSL